MNWFQQNLVSLENGSATALDIAGARSKTIHDKANVLRQNWTLVLSNSKNQSKTKIAIISKSWAMGIPLSGPAIFGIVYPATSPVHSICSNFWAASINAEFSYGIGSVPVVAPFVSVSNCVKQS